MKSLAFPRQLVDVRRTALAAKVRVASWKIGGMEDCVRARARALRSLTADHENTFRVHHCADWIKNNFIITLSDALPTLLGHRPLRWMHTLNMLRNWVPQRVMACIYKTAFNG